MSRNVFSWRKTPNALALKQYDCPSSSCYCCHRAKRRRFSTTVTALSDARDSRAEQQLNAGHDHLGRRAHEKLLDKDFFYSLLSSAATKRDARSFLSRFRAPKQPAAKTHNESKVPHKKQQQQQHQHQHQQPSLTAQTGVNLGNFYRPRAVGESPVFAQPTTPTPPAKDDLPVIHVALVKLKTPQALDDDTLQGIGRTLTQLSRLGMSCCVVLDPGLSRTDGQWRQKMLQQAARVAAAVDYHRGPGTRRLDDILSITASGVKVQWRKLLLNPLRNGHIVIMNPIGYTAETQTATPLNADEAVLTLTREFAGLDFTPVPDADPYETAEKINALQQEVSVDRLILLDPLGGIPKMDDSGSSHVFVNMEQEYDDIRKELTDGLPGSANGGSAASANPTTDRITAHLQNLTLSRNALGLLPPTSTALITTPKEAADSAKSGGSLSETSVGTRRKRNPLIHNLLTDKPAHSSSLPLGRLGGAGGSRATFSPVIIPSTMVKRGMPLTMLPDPREKAWTPHNDGQPRLDLSDPRIDLGRLVYLIEDSFGRKLDVADYLNRINNRVAGLIIAGEYEGGAILTWELPPGVPDDGSEASLSRMVPYLDKFAVLQRSQGAGGVADAVFNAMVRTCFPDGVCWRSRRDNPVNKWYFERAKGTWKLPDSNWTMFWTTEGVARDAERFADYEGVCRSVQPSWADKKSIVD